MGTSEGLNIYDPRNATIEKLRLRDFSSNTNNIISLYKDRNDTMWVCTRGGLFFLDKTGKFERLFLSPEIEENKDQFEIRDILQDSNGTYWVATENNGIFSFVLKNGNVTQVSNFNTSNSSIISNHVRKIKIINNQIWCATLDGVCTIQPQKKVIEYVKWEGLSDGSFHDIMEDKDGGIWIASYLAGVIYYHRSSFSSQNVSEILP